MFSHLTNQVVLENHLQLSVTQGAEWLIRLQLTAWTALLCLYPQDTAALDTDRDCSTRVQLSDLVAPTCVLVAYV